MYLSFLLNKGKLTFPWMCRSCQTETPSNPIEDSTSLSEMKEIQHRSKRRRLLTPPISLVPRTQTPTISLVPRTPTPPNSPTPVDDQVQQSLFADDLGSFVNPDQRNESNMLNDRLVPTPCHLIDDGVPVTYEIVSAATNRGKVIISLLNYCSSNTGFTEIIQKMHDNNIVSFQPRLVDSLGYSYTKRPLNQEHVTYWRCAVRNKNVYCKATLTQRDGSYTKCPLMHVCQSKKGNWLSCKNSCLTISLHQSIIIVFWSCRQGNCIRHHQECQGGRDTTFV